MRGPIYALAILLLACYMTGSFPGYRDSDGHRKLESSPASGQVIQRTLTLLVLMFQPRFTNLCSISFDSHTREITFISYSSNACGSCNLERGRFSEVKCDKCSVVEGDIRFRLVIVVVLGNPASPHLQVRLMHVTGNIQASIPPQKPTDQKELTHV
jgi:hypothetical protein